jgi:hypothetical protein
LRRSRLIAVLLILVLSTALSGCGALQTIFSQGQQQPAPKPATAQPSNTGPAQPKTSSKSSGSAFPMTAERNGLSISVDSAAFDKTGTLFQLTVTNNSKFAIQFDQEEFFVVLEDDSVMDGHVDVEDGKLDVAVGKAKQINISADPIPTNARTVTLLCGFHWADDTVFDYEFKISVR